MNPQLLAAAMRRLGRQIAVLTGAVTRATAKAVFGAPGRRGLTAAVGAGAAGVGSVAGLFTPLFTTLVGKITLALAPLAILGQTIAAKSSGFSAFLASTQLLGTVLGTLLLPAFAVLGAGVYALSGYIADKLLPVLGDYYDSIVNGAIDGVQKFEAALITASAYLRRFSEVVGSRSKNDERVKELDEIAKIMPETMTRRERIERHLRGAISGVDDSIDLILGRVAGGKVAGADFDKNLERIRKRDQANAAARALKPAAIGGLMGGAAVGATSAQTMTDRFREGLRAFAQEMRANMGPQAHYTTSADIYKQATTAGQMSPFQRMMLTLLNTALGYLEKSANNSRPAISH